MKIEKRYPEYIFTNDKGNSVSYRLDGTSALKGFGGQTVKNFPKAVSGSNYVIGYLFGRLYKPVANPREQKMYMTALDMMDKLSSISEKNLEICCDYDGYLKDVVELYTQTKFKTFCKAWARYNNDWIKYDTANILRAILWHIENPITLPESITYEALANIINLCDDHPEYVIKVLNYYNKYVMTPMAEVIGEYGFKNAIREYITLCIALHMEPDTGDMFKNIIKLRAIYEARKEAIDNETFKTSQEQFPLFYENETFSIIVPKTRQELLDEGEKLNNCLGSHEWNHYLRNGNRKVVFIRRKANLEKSYIACDINNSGRIIQFLTYNNNSVRAQDAGEFYKEYQNYLTTIWNKEE